MRRARTGRPTCWPPRASRPATTARGLGTLAVLNYDIHAARFVQKSHTALPSAFASPLVGPIGAVAEGRAAHPCARGPPAGAAAAAGAAARRSRW